MSLKIARLTRRHALQGATLAVGYLIADLTSPDRGIGLLVTPNPAPANVAAQATTVTTARFFDEAWSRGVELDFPVALAVQSPADRDATAVLTWDARLFEVDDNVFYSRSGQLESISLDQFESGRLAFTLPRDAHALYFQSRSTNTYPSDNVVDPIVTVLEVDGDELYRSAPRVTPASPWGIELRAEWAQHNGFTYPVSITALSIGPSPVPAGVAIVVRTYQSVGSELRVAEEEGVRADAPAPKNQVVDLSFEIIQALAAGEVANILLAAGEVDVNGVPAVKQVGQVFVSIPDSLRPSARATKKYDVAAVTASGTALTDASTQRKA
ncbi:MULTISPECIES: hypothetical protein [Microbacterium]|jgi:hypothetical protein|uniref:hypothetical protein n=1 Tax=Microbacterium TaxID=33882 RepID=UPI000E70D22B|nr:MULTISPECIES: hypothetical protein [Microbacterium]MDQ1216724.1 hypothetical protein [Microbacterium arborescens]RKE63641.1 hypothetical protein DEU36_0852 [Microbacterium sp. AG238]